MDLKDKNEEAQTEATFLVPMAYHFPYSKTTLSNKNNDFISDQNIPNRIINIGEIDRKAIKRIETDLKLTFLTEKDENSLVCMANSPEVRDDFKDVFDLKDLKDYIYAVLQASNISSRPKDLSEVKTCAVPYPKTTGQFWKLVSFGAQLRPLKLQDSTQDTDRKITAILEEIAKLA